MPCNVSGPPVAEPPKPHSESMALPFVNLWRSQKHDIEAMPFNVSGPVAEPPRHRSGFMAQAWFFF
jgi:hypothetical protein